MIKNHMHSPASRLKSRLSENGFSLIELLIVIAIILIILAIALPKLNQAKMNAYEMAAVSEIQTIHKAETLYMSQFGKYATSLAELGPPAGGSNAGPSSADLIPAGLATGEDSGYTFTVTGTPTGYAVTAVPKSFASTGRRTFFSDQTLVIHQNWGQEPATVQSAELK
jgi:type IV pilus assembly protein PilA